MTRVLGLAGARLPKDLLPPNFDNPEGFWESRAVIELNDEFLRRSGSDWEDVFAGKNSEARLLEVKADFYARVANTLHTAFNTSNLIVIKDPRINVLSPMWDAAIRENEYDPYYVFMVRHPLEIAASLAERNQFPVEKSLLLWLDNMCTAERATRLANRVFVAYSELLYSPRVAVKRIQDIGGIHLPRLSQSEWEEVERFLSPMLRHHRIDLQAEDKFKRDYPYIAAAYNWFVSAAEGRDRDDPSRLAPVDAYIESANKIFGPFVADLRGRHDQELMEFRQELAHLSGKLTAQAELFEQLKARAERQESELTQAATERSDERAANAVAYNALHAQHGNALARQSENHATIEELEITNAALQEANRRHSSRIIELGDSHRRNLLAIESEREISRAQHQSNVDCLVSKIEELLVTTEGAVSRATLLGNELVTSETKLKMSLNEIRANHEEKILLENKVTALESEITASAADLVRTKLIMSAESDALRKNVEELLSSTSWRLTKGFRWLAMKLRG